MAQHTGRTAVFTNYRLRIAGVIREYGMNEREEAPLDSKGARDLASFRRGHGAISYVVSYVNAIPANITTMPSAVVPWPGKKVVKASSSVSCGSHGADAPSNER